MVASFDYAYIVVGTFNCQSRSFPAGVAAPVYRNQEIVTPAFYIKRYFPVITYDDRAYVKTVTFDCGQDDCTALMYLNRDS